MKKLLLILLLPAMAFAQPPPIQTEPLSVNRSTHSVYPTDAISGILTDAMSALTVKPWCLVVATTNQTLSGTPTIDGTGAVAGNVVLLTAQTAGAENGPWVVASGSWTRPTWYASGHTTQASANVMIKIRGGTQYSGTWWRIFPTTGAMTIDTTATSWTQSGLVSFGRGIAGISASNIGVALGAAGRTGIALSATLTSDNSGNVSDGDAVTIRARVYTFKTTVVSSDQILIGANNDASLLNFSRAINNSGGTPGTDYSVTTANADVTASTVSAHAITVSAIYNVSLTLTLSETAATLVWSNSLTTANMVFSVSPTLTGLPIINGSLQIGTRGTSPTPLMAITPVSGPIAFTARIADSGSYAQFAMKNELDAQRGFMGFIGSSFGNANRQNNFEFGTSSGSRIAFRPGDGDGNQFLMDENGNLRFGNTAPGTGAQRVLVFGNSGVPTTSPANTGQLYSENGTLKWRGSAGTVTAIAIP